MFIFIKKIIGNFHSFIVLLLYLSQAHILLELVYRNITIKVTVHHHLVNSPYCVLCLIDQQMPLLILKEYHNYLKSFFRVGKNKTKNNRRPILPLANNNKILAVNLSINICHQNTVYSLCLSSYHCCDFSCLAIAYFV